MKTRFVMLMGLCMIITSSEIRAQIAQPLPTPGSNNPYINGQVVDESGHPIPSARIVATVFAAGTGQTAFSDDDGRFFFYEMAPQIYNLTVSASDFIEVSQRVDLTYGPQSVRIVMRRRDGKTPTDPARVVRAGDLSIPEKARKHYQDGVKELERKKYESGVTEFKKAIEDHPNFPAAHSAMGIAYIQLKKQDLAREAFETAIEQNDKSAEAHLGIGLLYNDEQAYVEAERHLLISRDLNPSDWQVHYELGRTWFGLNKLAEAEQSLKQVKETHPEYGNLYLVLANVLILQNRLAEGLGEMEEFLKVAPNSPLAPTVREKVKLLKAELGQP